MTTATERFERCLEQTLKWEGGYGNDPYDPGGATNFGIIQREYDAYRVRKGLPKQSVRYISRDEYRDIYRHSYWDEVRADELPAGVDLAVFDFGVNSGPTTAIKKLQLAVGVVADGHIGQITLDAIEKHDPDDIVSAVMEYRRAYLRSLKTFWRFGRGWMDRCDGIEHQGLTWGGSEHIAALADLQPAEPHPDPDTQAATQGRAVEPIPEATLATTNGKAAQVVGGGSAGSIGLEVGRAADGAYHAGVGFDFTAFVIALLNSPTFWVAAASLVAAVWIWYETKRQVVQGRG